MIWYFKFFIFCMEKICFSVSKDVVVSKEDVFVGFGVGVVILGIVILLVIGEFIEILFVIYLVIDVKGIVIYEVYV